MYSALGVVIALGFFFTIVAIVIFRVQDARYVHRNAIEEALHGLDLFHYFAEACTASHYKNAVTLTSSEEMALAWPLVGRVKI